MNEQHSFEHRDLPCFSDPCSLDEARRGGLFSEEATNNEESFSEEAIDVECGNSSKCISFAVAGTISGVGFIDVEDFFDPCGATKTATLFYKLDDSKKDE